MLTFATFLGFMSRGDGSMANLYDTGIDKPYPLHVEIKELVLSNEVLSVIYKVITLM